MRRPFGGVRLSRVNTALLMAGVALLLVAVLGRWVTVASNQILKGAPWWVQVVLGAVGLLAIAWAVATSREPARELQTVGVSSARHRGCRTGSSSAGTCPRRQWRHCAPGEGRWR